MRADELCTYHKDGWHRTLLLTVSLREPDPRWPNQKRVEHTCACWTPTPNNAGKMTIDTYETDMRFRWLGKDIIPLQ